MEQKRSFIRDFLSGSYYFSHLCKTYGISRKTGYKYVSRYEEHGDYGLLDFSSRPHHSYRKVTTEMSIRIRDLRNPGGKLVLGARKIRRALLSDGRFKEVPSAMTIHNELQRQGLIKKRKPRRKIYDQNTKNNPSACNEIWTIDYKGHFKMRNGRRCHPLTICDSYGRYILGIKGHYRETVRNVKQTLKSLFQEYGCPEYLLSDNGSCFASIQSPCGYGSLSYWLIDHGVIPLFSDPGCPGQNGRHERMHRDLKAYCCHPVSKDLRSQNRLLNKFKRFYNEERPHEELGDECPVDVYKSSSRSYVDKVKPYDYGSGVEKYRVSKNGAIRWGGEEWISVSQCLSEKEVGLKRIGELSYEVFYRDQNLGFFELSPNVEPGRYYRIISDRDMPARKGMAKSMIRKGR